MNACEVHDTGEVMLERADLFADWASEGFDPALDAIGVFDGDRVVAWALLDDRRNASVDVHPQARGRGIGSRLRGWSEERARQLAATRVTQVIDDRRADAIELLSGAGYTARGTSWILRMRHREAPARPEVPGGIELRSYRPADEDEALAVFERAFMDFEGRTPQSPVTWRAMVTRREGFRRDDLVLAVALDRIVGGAFLIDADEIWVDKLAVAREHRHRGIARALLQTAFARSFALGYAWTSLSTDSRTGALSLYERIGMTVHRSFTRWGLDLSGERNGETS